MYWVKYNENEFKFITEYEMKEKWTMIAINFLEMRLEAANNGVNVGGMVTRGMKRKIDNAGFGTSYEIKILRSVSLDKLVITIEQPRKIIGRRFTEMERPIVERPTIENYEHRARSQSVCEPSNETESNDEFDPSYIDLDAINDIDLSELLAYLHMDN